MSALLEQLARLAAVALWDLARRGLRLTPKVEEPPAQPWTHNDVEHVRQQARSGARSFKRVGGDWEIYE